MPKEGEQLEKKPALPSTLLLLARLPWRRANHYEDRDEDYHTLKTSGKDYGKKHGLPYLSFERVCSLTTHCAVDCIVAGSQLGSLSLSAADQQAQEKSCSDSVYVCMISSVSCRLIV